MPNGGLHGDSDMDTRTLDEKIRDIIKEKSRYQNLWMKSQKEIEKLKDQLITLKRSIKLVKQK